MPVPRAHCIWLTRCKCAPLQHFYYLWKFADTDTETLHLRHSLCRRQSRWACGWSLWGECRTVCKPKTSSPCICQEQWLLPKQKHSRTWSNKDEEVKKLVNKPTCILHSALHTAEPWLHVQTQIACFLLSTDACENHRVFLTDMHTKTDGFMVSCVILFVQYQTLWESASQQLELLHEMNEVAITIKKHLLQKCNEKLELSKFC